MAEADPPLHQEAPSGTPRPPASTPQQPTPSPDKTPSASRRYIRTSTTPGRHERSATGQARTTARPRGWGRTDCIGPHRHRARPAAAPRRARDGSLPRPITLDGARLRSSGCATTGDRSALRRARAAETPVRPRGPQPTHWRLERARECLTATVLRSVHGIRARVSVTITFSPARSSRCTMAEP